MTWRSMKTKDLEYQLGRLEWAADTTPDPLWRKAHLHNIKDVKAILAERKAAACTGSASLDDTRSAPSGMRAG